MTAPPTPPAPPPPAVPPASRRRAAALAVAALLTAGSAGTAGWALVHQQHAPQPTASSAGVLDPAPPAPSVPSQAGPTGGTTAAGATAGPTGRPPAGRQAPRPPVSLPRSVPVRLRIPAIGVTSPVQALGLAPDGSLAVPQPGPDYDQAAWYSGSPTPGQPGPSVLEGHVDSAAAGPSVFFRLGALRPGNAVEVARADGSVAVFTVDAVRSFRKDAFPSALVYGNTERPALRLLTCGGSFDAATGHYRDNTVVFASLTGTRPAPGPAA